MELRNSSVFLDFDGTITTYDTGLHLLERLAPARWQRIEERYLSGQIGSRECMVGQWALLPRNRALIESVTREVPLDASFEALVSWLRSAGATVTIVSDGYGFFAEEVGRRAGVPVLTNQIDWERFEVIFPNGDETCLCSGCGTCKQAPIRAAQSIGSTTILIGDGTSDAKAAEIADVVFAKGHLVEWCTRRDLPCRQFSDLADVLGQLKEMSAG